MKQRVLALGLALFFVLSCVNLFAHSGGTDGAGGHKGPDGYHYHHGYPEHQHDGGVCPYDYDDRTGWNSGSSSGGSNSYSVFGETATPEPTATPAPTPQRTSYTYTPRPEPTPYSYYVPDDHYAPDAEPSSALSDNTVLVIVGILVFVLLGVATTPKSHPRKQRTKEERERIKSNCIAILLLLFWAFVLAYGLLTPSLSTTTLAFLMLCAILIIFSLLYYYVKEKIRQRRENRVQKEKLSVRIKAFFARHQWIMNILGFAAIVVGLTLSVLLYNLLFSYLPKKYSEDDMLTLKDEAYHEGYDNGYDDGYDDGGGGFFNGYDSGYEDGHDDGYKEGHNDGYGDGYENCTIEMYPEWYDIGADDGYKEGFEDGYDIGYDHRDEHIDKYSDALLVLLWERKSYLEYPVPMLEYPIKESAHEEDVSYKEGTYAASAVGFGGVVEVEVTISADGTISKVEAEGEYETTGIGSRAIEYLPDAIIEAQSADVDTVAGASFTSKAIIEATEAILKKAAE